MSSSYRCAAAVLAILAATAVTASAQTTTPITVSRGSYAVAPYGGYLLSEDFVDGPLGTSLGAVSSPVYGAQLSLPLAPSASLVGSIGYASGDLDVGLPLIGGVRVGDTNALLFDGAVELRASSARLSPFVQLGGGAIRREVSVAGVSANTTDFQVVGGLGADLPIGPGFALRLMAKDYYGKADFGGVGDLRARTNDFHNVALMAGLQFTF